MYGYYFWWQPVEYQLYVIKKEDVGGGCNIKHSHTEYFQINDENNEIIEQFVCRSLKTSNNNCAIGLFTNQLKIKLKSPDYLRDQLKIEKGTFITRDQLDLLVDYFKCDITLYEMKKTFEVTKITNRHSRRIEAYLSKEHHYWIIDKKTMRRSYKICDECGKEITNGNHSCDIDLELQYHALINEYPNIECTKYIFSYDKRIKNKNNIPIFPNYVSNCRKQALYDLAQKNQITINKYIKIEDNFINKFYLCERVVIKRKDGDNIIHITITLVKYYQEIIFGGNL